MLNRVFTILIAVGLCVSCAKEDVTKPRQPLNEAYRLMDRGENAKAILLLERYLKDQPTSKEARVLVASAYMGEAGVDIYRSYDSFKDILFSLPLGERLGRAPAAPPPSDVVVHPDAAPLEKLINYADLALGKAKHILSFLSRFPKVGRDQWPLVDRSLEHLDLEHFGGDAPTNDERLYRTFIRVVYLKSFLDQEVLEDDTFGSIKWMCNLDFLSLISSFTWSLKHLRAVTSDLKQVFPDKKGEVIVLHDAVSDVLKAIEERTPTGTKTMVLGLELTLKEQFRCKNLQK